MAQSHEERFEDRRPARALRAATAVTLIGGSSYIAMLVALVRSVLIMRLIGPRGRGIQRLAGLYKGYLSNLAIGWRHGVSKELPLAIGAEDPERVARVEDAGYASVGAVTLLAGLGMIVYAAVFCGGGWETRVAIALGGLLLAAEDMTQLYWVVLRSWGAFGTLAVAELVRTVAQFALMCGGAWLLGVTGVMLGWVAAGVALLLFLDRASRIRVSLRIEMEDVWRVLLIGLPVALVSFSDVLLRSIDGTVLVHFYGEEQFGLYSVAMQMATYLFAIPQAAGFVIWPKVLEAYGAEDADERRRRRVLLPTIAMAAAMPVIGGMAVLALPWGIDLVVPRFAPSVPAAQVLSMGATFLALPLATNAALVADDREPAVIVTKLVGAAVAGAGTWYLVTHAGSMESVAACACVGFAIAAVLSLAILLRDFVESRRRLTVEVALALTPTAWAVGALWAAARAANALGLIPHEPAGAAASIVVFLVASAPLLVYAHVRTGAGHEIAQIIRDRFRS